MFRTWLSKLAVLGVLLAAEAGFAQRQPETAGAFDGYIVQAEARIGRARSDTKSFVSLESPASWQREEVMRRLRQGEVVIEKFGRYSGRSSWWIGS